MLTQIVIHNFKRLKDVEIPLSDTVVFIGPNNSGKTTALQALALWDIGVRAWGAKREGKSSPEKRPGVAINRRDLISTPVPSADLLWHGLHVRRAKTSSNEQGMQNIRIDIEVHGVTDGKQWKCGFEFDFTNDESFVCRPMRMSGYNNIPVKDAKFSEIPDEASKVKIAFLPPMSGLAAEEPLLQTGRINVLMGQGQTAQVLRNLCYRIIENDRDKLENNWELITSRIKSLFGVQLTEPLFIQDRGEITLGYEEQKVQLDISASGRGLQQTLLLLSHLYLNPGTVLLMDEPDAHLEILRQREIFRVITEVAGGSGSQIIAASHSEVILNEAADSATVVAFVGTPHRLDEQKSQVLKSLQSIGWEQYYQAEESGWVLYLEGATDLEILRTFALILQYERAIELLSRPFVHYLGNNHPPQSRDHFHGLRYAKSDLVGIALFDRLPKALNTEGPLTELMWQRREIENYFCTEKVLMAYARHDRPDDLFELAESEERCKAMEDSIKAVTESLETLGNPPAWSHDIKATDEFLEPLFRLYFKKLKLPILLRKTNYHQLAKLLGPDEIDPEIRQKLEAIVKVADKAQVRSE